MQKFTFFNGPKLSSVNHSDKDSKDLLFLFNKMVSRFFLSLISVGYLDEGRYTREEGKLWTGRMRLCV